MNPNMSLDDFEETKPAQYSNQGNYQADRPRNNGGDNGNGNRPNNFSNKGNYSKNNFQKKEVNPEDVTLYKPYVATGNKDAPANIVEKFQSLVKEIDTFGYIMRTSCLQGVEEILEKLPVNKEVHLPWRGFGEKESKFTYTAPEAKVLAARFHPGFDALKLPIQGFKIKDVRLVMGQNVKSPALFCLIWSEDGAESTQEKTQRTLSMAFVIALAEALKIPVFNLGKPDAEARLKRYLQVS